MKKLVLSMMLLTGSVLGLNSTASAEMPIETCLECGFGNLKLSSQIVPIAVAGLVITYAVQQSDYDCKIVETAPKPGTNFVNEKSVCTKK